MRTIKPAILSQICNFSEGENSDSSEFEGIGFLTLEIVATLIDFARHRQNKEARIPE